MAERKKKNPAETKKPKEKKVLTYGDAIKDNDGDFKKELLSELKKDGIKLTDPFPEENTVI